MATQQTSKFHCSKAPKNKIGLKKYQDVALDFYKAMWPTEEIAKSTLKTDFNRKSSETIFVHHNDTEQLVGFATINFDKKLKEGVIEAICIQDEFQGQGAGSALLKDILSRFAKKVSHLQAHVHVDNQKSHRLFQANGAQEAIPTNLVEVSKEYQFYVIELNKT